MLAHFNSAKITRDPAKVPYYYQTEAVEATELCWYGDGWGKALVNIPTGGGKSQVVHELSARGIEAGGRCLFLAHTRELVTQPKLSFEQDFGCAATIEMGSSRADDSPMVFASVQTMLNRIKKGLWRPDTFKRIVFDETHRVLSAGHSCVASFFGNEDVKIVGVTATPRRGDKKDLLTFFDGISYDKPIQELFAEGFLIEPTVVQEPLSIKLSHKGSGDFSDEEVGHAIEPYLDDAADRVMKWAPGRCGISFLPLRPTARKFCEKLRSRGLKAEYIGGDLDETEQKWIKRRLILGEIDHVCNAMIWGEGVDIRPCNLLVDLRPTTVWTAAMQKWGRMTRTYDPSAPYADPKSRWGKKQDGILLDFCFEADNHSMLQRPAVMVAKDDEEAKAITEILAKGGGGNIMEAQKKAASDREETLRKRLEAMQSRSARTVSAMELFTNLHMPDMAEWQPMSRQDTSPILDSQRIVLEKNGIAVDSVLGFGHARAIIDNLRKERWDKGMATVPQVKWAIDIGLPSEQAWSMTFADMSTYLTRVKAQKQTPHWK